MSRSPVLRLAALASATLVALGLAAATAPAAYAASVGYVRLAHLSPDTPEVDVYVTSVSGAIEPKVFPAVGYGVVSAYLPLPTGQYTVAMRAKGAPATDPPVLSKVATVEEGKAYTVAGVGRYASLGLEILVDDLSRPAPGSARVRIVHASVRAPQLKVYLAGGAAIADDVRFASTTAYREVGSGHWSLRLEPQPTGTAATVEVSLGAGNVYSLIVLDGTNGLRAELRTDARGGSTVPVGGVDTGGGGDSPAQRTPMVLLWGGVALALLFSAGLAYRLSRRTGSGGQ